MWKLIPGYEGRYRINEEGHVDSCFFGTWRRRRTSITPTGYHNIALCLRAERREYRLARLVAELFIPNLEDKPEVNHIDGDKDNNHADNLEWMTHEENMAHAAANGLIPDRRGERNGRSALTAEQVKTMRRIYEEGGKTQTQVGKMFGASPYRAHRVLRYKQWTHI